jgi:hypothetical protein
MESRRIFHQVELPFSPTANSGNASKAGEKFKNRNPDRRSKSITSAIQRSNQDTKSIILYNKDRFVETWLMDSSLIDGSCAATASAEAGK